VINVVANLNHSLTFITVSIEIQAFMCSTDGSFRAFQTLVGVGGGVSANNTNHVLFPSKKINL
jgi:hypothetical protein